MNTLSQRRTAVISTNIIIPTLLALKCRIALRKLTILLTSRRTLHRQTSRIFARTANAIPTKSTIDWAIVVTFAFFAQAIAAGRPAIFLAILRCFTDFALVVAAGFYRAVLRAIGRCFACRAFAVAASDAAVFCAVVLASWVLFAACIGDAFAVAATAAAVFRAIFGVFAAAAFAVAAGDGAVLRASAVFFAAWRAFAVAAGGSAAGWGGVRDGGIGGWFGRIRRSFS